MLRFEVSEEGREALPAIDLDDAIVVIGSASDARVRLPAAAADAEHVVVERGRWKARGRVTVEGAARDAGAVGDIGEGVSICIGGYRVRVAPSPSGAMPMSPQRTESLARELMRSLLGTGAAPTLEVEKGPTIGDKRMLAPPESTLVIGRGDEAGWCVLDEDLSRAHAEVKRGWDGTRIVDLGSKNGTLVDGVAVGADGAVLHDGALVELGKVALRFRDPAERQLGVAAPTKAAPPTKTPAPTTTAAPVVSVPPVNRPSTAPFYLAIFVMVMALTGLVWILAIA